MITLFRRIREKLIASGSVTKYLLYAMGEILLVVIGILIALQINNWNESRKQRIAEQDFIAGVKFDLTQDQQYIQLILDTSEKKLKLFDLLEEQAVELYENDRAKLDSLFNAYFVPSRTFYPISGSFQSAVSGNEISKFKNKEFTSAATRLYNSTYARLIDNAKEADNRWYYTGKKNARIRRTGRLPDMSREELMTILDDYYYYDLMLEYYVNVLKDTHREIDRIMNMD
ncbi:DUF6090 family protein [Balneola sp. MJW-20]|uniref:DUF6090 family protein n=1 Tax=Gracilimonas aurantiaca TaxID=3234185 RepID=UPI003466B3AB